MSELNDVVLVLSAALVLALGLATAAMWGVYRDAIRELGASRDEWRAREREWIEERRKLLDRIQAPDLSVYKRFQSDEQPATRERRRVRTDATGLIRMYEPAEPGEAEAEDET